MKDLYGNLYLYLEWAYGIVHIDIYFELIFSFIELKLSPWNAQYSHHIKMHFYIKFYLFIQIDRKTLNLNIRFVRKNDFYPSKIENSEKYKI